MNIRLSCVLARDRATGEKSILVQALHMMPGTPVPEIAAAYQEFREAGEHGDELRARYSHVSLMIENQVRESLELPDPLNEERRKLEQQLREARESHAAALALERSTRDLANKAKTAAKDRTAIESNISELTQKLEAIQPEILTPKTQEADPGQKSPEAARNQQPGGDQPPAAGKSPADDLRALSDEDLGKAAKAFDLDPGTFPSREPLIAAILQRAGYLPEGSSLVAGTAEYEAKKAQLDSLDDAALAAEATLAGVSPAQFTGLDGKLDREGLILAMFQCFQAPPLASRAAAVPPQ